MKFKWFTTGNHRVIEFLEKSLNNDNIANFYVFSGLEGLGKFSVAKDFVRNIFLKDKPELKQQENFLEVNSDFFVVEREEDKKNISIEQIRSLIERFKSSSFLNSYRVAIIKDGHFLNQNSANALLKILEEFNNKTVIILTVNDIDNLPKTIASRAQVINFFPVKDDLIYKDLVDNFSVNPSLAKNLARLSSGRPSLALKFLQDEDLYQDYQKIVLDFADFILFNFPERLKIIEGLIKKNEQLNKINILEVWQSVIRDLIFVDYGQYDLVRNDFAIDKLKNIKINNNDLNPVNLRKKSLIIKEGLGLWQANINIRSVLEYIAVNI